MGECENGTFLSGFDKAFITVALDVLRALSGVNSGDG